MQQIMDERQEILNCFQEAIAVGRVISNQIASACKSM
jgi:hypothetical protein